MKNYYVYILASKCNGTLYIGVSSNLLKRIWQHKNKVVAGFSAKFGIDKLVYFDEHKDIITAIQREKKLKAWKRAWKIKLIEKINLHWLDLYYELF